MVTKIVTVHNASLHTMSVAIKSLIVSGKQMTLSVFRQLPEYRFDEVCDPDLLSEPFTLPFLGDALPWGIVRYYWAHYPSPPSSRRSDGLRDDAYHVVVQRGDALVRFFASSRGNVYAYPPGSWSQRTWCYTNEGVDAMDVEQVQQWRACVLSLFGDLPQLFIAV